MKKRLNEKTVINELRGSSLYFQKQPTIRRVKKPVETVVRMADKLIRQATSQPTGQLTNQLTDKTASQKIDSSSILGRPKAFYITEKQDKDLDIAVEKLNKKLKEKANQKIDRSTVIRLLLEISQITDNKTISRLASQLISRLVSQLIN